MKTCIVCEQQVEVVDGRYVEHTRPVPNKRPRRCIQSNVYYISSEELEMYDSDEVPF